MDEVLRAHLDPRVEPALDAVVDEDVCTGVEAKVADAPRVAAAVRGQRARDALERQLDRGVARLLGGERADGRLLRADHDDLPRRRLSRRGFKMRCRCMLRAL